MLHRNFQTVNNQIRTQPGQASYTLAPILWEPPILLLIQGAPCKVMVASLPCHSIDQGSRGTKPMWVSKVGCGQYGQKGVQKVCRGAKGNYGIERVQKIRISHPQIPQLLLPDPRSTLTRGKYPPPAPNQFSPTLWQQHQKPCTLRENCSCSAQWHCA